MPWFVRESIPLLQILDGWNDLEIPPNMKPTNPNTANRHDMVNMMKNAGLQGDSSSGGVNLSDL